MKDYIDIWTRWIGFLQSDVKVRKKTLDVAHAEVKNGFSAIAKMSLEQLEHNLSHPALFIKIKSDLAATLSYCLWSGYVLYLTNEGIDPVKEDLAGRKETSGLGDLWMENYEKDKTSGLLINIDPIFGLFLQNASIIKFNQLVVTNPDLAEISYKDSLEISTFLQWVTNQGFLLGILEQELKK